MEMQAKVVIQDEFEALPRLVTCLYVYEGLDGLNVQNYAKQTVHRS